MDKPFGLNAKRNQMKTDITTVRYDIHDLAEYINWIYFFHAWGFQPRFATIADTVGAFATTIDERMEEPYQNDDYKHLLVKTLGERLAEAAAEKLHEFIRKKAWGYAPDEQLTMKQLLNEDYQGIRPAVGYPSLPDISVSYLLDELIDMKRIGIHLTENGMMQPHASVCGLMFSHPASRYFAVGKIDEEQLKDYAERRGFSVKEMRKYLSANLQD